MCAKSSVDSKFCLILGCKPHVRRKGEEVGLYTVLRTYEAKVTIGQPGCELLAGKREAYESTEGKVDEKSNRVIFSHSKIEKKCHLIALSTKIQYFIKSISLPTLVRGKFRVGEDANQAKYRYC